MTLVGLAFALDLQVTDQGPVVRDDGRPVDAIELAGRLGELETLDLLQEERRRARQRAALCGLGGLALLAASPLPLRVLPPSPPAWSAYAPRRADYGDDVSSWSLDLDQGRALFLEAEQDYARAVQRRQVATGIGLASGGVLLALAPTWTWTVKRHHAELGRYWSAEELSVQLGAQGAELRW